MTLPDDAKTTDYNALYDDLIGDRTILGYSKNRHQHYNHITAITNIPDYLTYDIFVKVDDDDIYKKHYIQTIVDGFIADPSIDITSSRVNYELNGYTLFAGVRETDLGANPPGSTYHMPFSFALNKKAMEITLAIQPSELSDISHDLTWRNKWSSVGLNHQAVNNRNNLIWHIHGKNISTGFMLL